MKVTVPQHLLKRGFLCQQRAIITRWQWEQDFREVITNCGNIGAAGFGLKLPPLTTALSQQMIVAEQDWQSFRGPLLEYLEKLDWQIQPGPLGVGLVTQKSPSYKWVFIYDRLLHPSTGDITSFELGTIGGADDRITIEDLIRALVLPADFVMTTKDTKGRLSWFTPNLACIIDCPVTDAVGKLPDEVWRDVPGKTIRFNDSVVLSTMQAYLFCEDVPVGTSMHLRFAIRLPIAYLGQCVGTGTIAFSAQDIYAPLGRLKESMKIGRHILIH